MRVVACPGCKTCNIWRLGLIIPINGQTRWQILQRVDNDPHDLAHKRNKRTTSISACTRTIRLKFQRWFEVLSTILKSRITYRSEFATVWPILKLYRLIIVLHTIGLFAAAVYAFVPCEFPLSPETKFKWASHKRCKVNVSVRYTEQLSQTSTKNGNVKRSSPARGKKFKQKTVKSAKKTKITWYLSMNLM